MQGTCYGYQVESAFRFRYLRSGEGEMLRVVPCRQGEPGPQDRLLREWTPRAPHHLEAQLYHNGRTFRLRVGDAEWFEVDPVARIIAVPDPDDPLLKLDNVVLTPHYASYTEEAYAEMRRKVVEGVAAALRGEFPRVVVNPEVRPHARLLRLRPAG